MKNQDNPQGRHFGFSSETNRDRFLDVQSGPADREPVLIGSKGQTGFEGHGTLFTPWGSTRCWAPQAFSNGCTAIQTTAGLDFWNENKETKDKKSTESAPSSCWSPQQLITPSHKTLHILNKYSTHTSPSLLYVVPWTKNLHFSRKHQETKCCWSPQQIRCLLATKI